MESPSPLEERLWTQSPTLRIVSYGPILVSVNHEPASVEGVEEVSRAVHALARERAERVALVVAPSAPRPKLRVESSRAILEEWARFRDDVAGVAVWVRAEGFTAAVLRSIVTGLNIARPASVTQVELLRTSAEIARFALSLVPLAEDEHRLATRLDALVAR